MEQLAWKSWHAVLRLREDLKSGELPMNLFAADLYEVLMQQGKHPIYEHPDEFFALTYPTYNLRKLVKDVILRLAGKNDKAVRQLELTYGGGKTHTLIALRHLVSDPAQLPDLPAVEEFKQDIGILPPQCRVVGLCFDKIDPESGSDVRAPDGKLRRLKHPWSILAYQLAGDEGLALIHADHLAEERVTPPAENLMTELLAWPAKDGLGTLVLIDEVLIFARQKFNLDPVWQGILQDFFQYLTQAASKTPRCCIVASLLASDPSKNDSTGMTLQSELAAIFQRQKEETIEPVVKEDVAEVLKRRFFTPESLKTSQADLKQHVVAALKGITALDDQLRLKAADAEERFAKSYPFHPDLTEVLYSKWTSLAAFQRTRGVLRTFALALRAAEAWDTSPVIGPAVFLPAPGQTGLSEALDELVTVANAEVVDGRRPAWTGILSHELESAREIQEDTKQLKGRELEQAVIATFLHSQPQGNSAHRRELIVLSASTRPDKIELEKALQRWAQTSHWLDDRNAPEEAGKLPEMWRLGTRPNLNQMHAEKRRNLDEALILARLLQDIRDLKQLTAGAGAAGASVHNLPEKPKDIQDDGAFHYAVLGLEAASESGKPSELAKRFLEETTSSDRPRVFRNAVVLLVPSRDGVEAAKARVADYLAWELVLQDLKKQMKEGDVDAARLQTLTQNLNTSKGKVPEAISQAYCLIVTIGPANEVQAFRISVGVDHHFLVAKNDKRARITDSAISAATLLPDGPYDLWRAGETSRRVKDLAGAFAQYPHLPKMIRQDAILSTLLDGCEAGAFVLRLPRPDGSARTWWMIRPDEASIKDPALELGLSEHAELMDLDPILLAPRRLPQLWTSPSITFKACCDYFDGRRDVSIDRNGYSETIRIPRTTRTVVESAVNLAVERGGLWLVAGQASLWSESVPPGIVDDEALLQNPPEPIMPAKLLPSVLPTAWSGDKASGLSLLTQLSSSSSLNLPWKAVSDAISAALKAHFLEIADSSQTWPCNLAGSQFAHFRLPTTATTPIPRPEQPPTNPNIVRARAQLEGAAIQDLGDVANELLELRVKYSTAITFEVTISLGDGTTPPPAEAIQKVNTILKTIHSDLQLQ